jgi:AraC-like DNA-binding protein
MKFDKYFPAEILRNYIKYYVVSESDLASEYKVFPSTGLVIGFQYSGNLATVNNNVENELSSAGITGISDGYKIFKNSNHIGSVLIFFTEIGFTYFASHPANELFNLSTSLADIFKKAEIEAVEDRLQKVNSDAQRVKVVEVFLLSQLKSLATDQLVMAAVQLIYDSRGTIRIKELCEKLCISQSPFEKRFRKVVGTTAKKFASIVRFNTVLSQLNQTKSLTEICYENNFFDQAHLTKDFKQFTGDTPENLKRLL